MSTIISDLIVDHKRFRYFLTRYERELDALRFGTDPDYSLLNDLAEYFSLFPDELHHRREDILYDFLCNNEDERATSPSQGNARLHDLRADHAVISQDAATFREGIAQVLSDGQLPRDTLTHYGAKYILTLRAHMHQEEESFFPRALAVIRDAEWTLINSKIEELLADDIDRRKADEILLIENSLFEQMAKS